MPDENPVHYIRRNAVEPRTDRDRHLLAYLQEHTVAEAAIVFDLSRARIYQILGRYMPGFLRSPAGAPAFPLQIPVLEALNRYIVENGKPPSLYDLGSVVGADVHRVILELERELQKGAVVQLPHDGRSKYHARRWVPVWYLRMLVEEGQKHVDDPVLFEQLKQLLPDQDA